LEFCSAEVDERVGLGDELPPDFLSRVREGAFYGWPWFYIGANEDPRHPGEQPALRSRGNGAGRPGAAAFGFDAK